MTALEELRMRLKYQAAALTCSLSPKDCREMLLLVSRAESDARGFERVEIDACLEAGRRSR